MAQGIVATADALSLVRHMNDLAKVAVRILRRIELEPLAAADEHRPVRSEGDAFGIMRAAADFRLLAPNDPEAVDARLALPQDQVGRNRSPRRWCRSVPPPGSSGRRAGYRRNRDGRPLGQGRPDPPHEPAARRPPLACGRSSRRPATGFPPSRSPAPSWSVGTPEPGRNAIAQGELNLATSATEKGRSFGWAVVDDGDPQAARASRKAACIKRRLIQTVPSA